MQQGQLLQQCIVGRGLAFVQHLAALCCGHPQVGLQRVGQVAAQALAQKQAVFHGEVFVVRGPLVAHALKGFLGLQQALRGLLAQLGGGGLQGAVKGLQGFCVKQSCRRGRRTVGRPCGACAPPAQRTEQGDTRACSQRQHRRLDHPQQHHHRTARRQHAGGNVQRRGRHMRLRWRGKVVGQRRAQLGARMRAVQPLGQFGVGRGLFGGAGLALVQQRSAPVDGAVTGDKARIVLGRVHQKSLMGKRGQWQARSRLQRRRAAKASPWPIGVRF